MVLQRVVGLVGIEDHVLQGGVHVLLQKESVGRFFGKVAISSEFDHDREGPGVFRKPEVGPEEVVDVPAEIGVLPRKGQNGLVRVPVVLRFVPEGGQRDVPVRLDVPEAHRHKGHIHPVLHDVLHPVVVQGAGVRSYPGRTTTHRR